MDIPIILNKIRPSSSWTLKNNDFSTLEWNDTEYSIPSWEEIVEAWPEVQQELDMAKIPDVSPRQIRIWLIRQGIDNDVEEIIESIPDETERKIALVEWQYAESISRAHPLVNMVGQMIGMSYEQLNEAFLTAYKI